MVPSPRRKTDSCRCDCRQLDELAALGIHGKTPGGTKWRHKYNLRSNATGEDVETVQQFNAAMDAGLGESDIGVLYNVLASGEGE